MNSRTIETAIPIKTVEDLIAAHLQAITIIRDDEDVDVKFEADVLQKQEGMLPLKLEIKEVCDRSG